jgi:protein SCO1/2
MLSARFLRIVPALGVAVTVAGSCHDVPLHGVVIDDPRPAAPLVVRMASGRPYDLRADTGKLVLLYFGYAHCPDYCPMMLTDWKRVRHDLGALADRMRFVFVSVDPDRDTPEGTEAFVRGFDSSFVGLAPRQAELDAIKQAWDVVSYKEVSKSPGRPADMYGVAHPAHAYLINRAGRLQAMYPPETRWQDVAADMRKLQ